MNDFHYLHTATQMSPEDDRQVARIAPGNPPCSLVYEIIMTVFVTKGDENCFIDIRPPFPLICHHTAMYIPTDKMHVFPSSKAI
jgi:hypothetical protein